MKSLKNFENLKQYKKSVASIYKELGNGYNKHSTITNLVKHMPKHERHFGKDIGKDIVKVFIKNGLLRKPRTDTFCWTETGLKYYKRLIENERGTE